MPLIEAVTKCYSGSKGAWYRPHYLIGRVSRLHYKKGMMGDVAAIFEKYNLHYEGLLKKEGV